MKNKILIILSLVLFGLVTLYIFSKEINKIDNFVGRRPWQDKNRKTSGKKLRPKYPTRAPPYSTRLPIRRPPPSPQYTTRPPM